MCDRWFRDPRGERVLIDEPSLLWLPLSFEPATGVARMLYVDESSPME